VWADERPVAIARPGSELYTDGAAAESPGPVKVLFLSPHYGIVGGVRIIVDALARATLDAGWQVTAVVDGDARAFPGPAREVAAVPFPKHARELKRLWRFTRRFPRTATRMVRAVRLAAPDLVSVHCVRHFAPYAAFLRRVTRVPQIVSLQEAAVPAGTPENLGLLRMLVRTADGVAACSEESADYARRVGGARRVRIVPNGYDPHEFGAGATFSSPHPYVLGVGRLEEQKGFDLLIRAMARLDRTDVDLLLAGDGSRRGALEREAAAAGIGSRVRFLGATDRDTTVALYRGAALVACPSRFEGLPLVCIEALAAARPVVATRVNGIPEVVRDEETGLLVASEDVDALAAAIGRVLATPDLAAALGARGRRLVERQNAWTAVAERYLALCSDVLGVPVLAEAASAG
jgi:glycogen synthase